ncbi:hypothetical protein B7494_g3890 [Chlorociboria aeruginascens]|nr:hypothetical protein B7494_g3890 [Chlorociboria aeruginascens]
MPPRSKKTKPSSDSRVYTVTVIYDNRYYFDSWRRFDLYKSNIQVSKDAVSGTAEEMEIALKEMAHTMLSFWASADELTAAEKNRFQLRQKVKRIVKRAQYALTSDRYSHSVLNNGLIKSKNHEHNDPLPKILLVRGPHDSHLLGLQGLSPMKIAPRPPSSDPAEGRNLTAQRTQPRNHAQTTQGLIRWTSPKAAFHLKTTKFTINIKQYLYQASSPKRKPSQSSSWETVHVLLPALANAEVTALAPDALTNKQPLTTKHHTFTYFHDSVLLSFGRGCRAS